MSSEQELAAGSSRRRKATSQSRVRYLESTVRSISVTLSQLLALRGHSPADRARHSPTQGYAATFCRSRRAAVVLLFQVVDWAVTKHGPPPSPCRVSPRHPGWVSRPIGVMERRSDRSIRGSGRRGSGATGTASVTSPVRSRHSMWARRCPGRRQTVRLRLRHAHPGRRNPKPAHLDGSPKRCRASPIRPTGESVTANRWRHEFAGRLDRRLDPRSAHVQRDSANRTRSAGGGMRDSGTSAHVARRSGCVGGSGPCKAEARRVGAAPKISAR